MGTRAYWLQNVIRMHDVSAAWGQSSFSSSWRRIGIIYCHVVADTRTNSEAVLKETPLHNRSVCACQSPSPLLCKHTEGDFVNLRYSSIPSPAYTHTDGGLKPKMYQWFFPHHKMFYSLTGTSQTLVTLAFRCRDSILIESHSSVGDIGSLTWTNHHQNKLTLRKKYWNIITTHR